MAEPPRSQRTRLRFGPFELDARAGELRKHGIRLRLREQPFQILLMLLEHPGEIVLREEIRSRLWPNDTVVEFDHGINAAVQKLRDTLGESANQPRYIETVGRRGYRFRGTVEEAGAPESGVEGAVLRPEAAPPPSRDSDGLIGATISDYRVAEKLDSGAMGVVYRAEDIRLGRQVALKFLPEDLADNPAARMCFEGEARAASAVTHPNICTVHRVEEFAGQPVIVMELLEGETLAARLAKGPLPLSHVLRLASQIAGALDAAHRRGIVHRDLKPLNIMLTRTGPKLLDFGIARMDAVAREQTASRATMSGAIVGTPQYMSPEQARGEDVDARSDIFSFGLVLYEMLTGRRAFEGEDSAAVATALVTQPLAIADGVASAELRRVLLRCLAKDPDERWQSAADLKAELEWIAQLPSTDVPLKLSAKRARLAVEALLAFALAVLGVIHYRAHPSELAAERFFISAPEKTVFNMNANLGGPVAISPDGRRLVFSARAADGTDLLWIRSLDRLAAQPLFGTEGATHPFWAPDSRFLGFFAGNKLKKMDSSGGSPITLCDAPFGRGGAWNRDGVIVFAPNSVGPLYRIFESGGVPRPATMLDTTKHETNHRWPSFLPGGRHFLYTGVVGISGGSIHIASLDSSTVKAVLEEPSNAIYAEGNLLFLRETTLLAQPFDGKRLAFTGEAVRVAEHVQTQVGKLYGVFSSSDGGLLAYQSGLEEGQRLAWFDRSGKALESLGQAHGVKGLEFSPDRKRVAVTMADLASHNTNIWIFEVPSGRSLRFTSDPADDSDPVWSPDGSTIVFASNRKGHYDLYRKSSSGIGSEEVLYTDDHNKRPTSWSPEGKFLLYSASNDTDAAAERPNRTWNLWVLPDPGGVPGRQKPLPFAQSQFRQDFGKFSPDGRWAVYTSQESGRQEVYVVPSPGPGARQLVSRNGGQEPRWRADGRAVFYFGDRFTDHGMMEVEVNAKGNRLEVGEARALFGPVKVGRGYQYDVSSDGQRFLLIQEQTTNDPLTIVRSWARNLTR